MDRRDLASFFYHAFRVCGGRFYLTADRSVHDGCDLFDDFGKVSALFRDQGRICGNAADHAHVICFSDIFHICCINKKFHNIFLFSFSCFSILQFCRTGECTAELPGKGFVGLSIYNVSKHKIFLEVTYIRIFVDVDSFDAHRCCPVAHLLCSQVIGERGMMCATG